MGLPRRTAEVGEKIGTVLRHERERVTQQCHAQGHGGGTVVSAAQHGAHWRLQRRVAQKPGGVGAHVEVAVRRVLRGESCAASGSGLSVLRKQAFAWIHTVCVGKGSLTQNGRDEYTLGRPT
jgi:hypothetical protein